jgi:Flp pilus assembly protein TadD
LDDEAKAYYQQLKAASDSAALSAFNKKATESLAAGNFDEAITYFEKVVAIDEKYQNGNALISLAKAYAGKDDKENAKSRYNKVIELFGEESSAGKAAKTALEGL